MRITIKEIARELGLSHSTVSRVLNDKESSMISEPTRVRIMETAHRMGYRPNRLAQALQGTSTRLVGLFLPTGTDHFFSVVERNLREHVEESGYELLPFEASPANVSASWSRLLSWQLDGIFAFDYLLHYEGLQGALADHKGAVPPLIALFGSEPRLADFVTFDFRPAMEAVLRHFVDSGSESIGYVALEPSLNEREQRYGAYSRFVESHRLGRVNIPLKRGDNLCESARITVNSFIDAGKSVPDALFCQNDEIALGTYRALYERGIEVPNRVRIAGCDDIPYMAYLEKPLTTVTLPVEEACSTAWRFLKERMASAAAPPLQAVLPAQLKIRESSLPATRSQAAHADIDTA